MGASGNLLDGAVLLNPGSDYRVRGTFSSPDLTLEGQVLYVLADDEEVASEAFLPDNFPLSSLPPPLSPANRTDNYGFSSVDENNGRHRAGGSAQVEHAWSWAEAEEKPSDFEHYSFRKSRFGVMASHHDFLRKVIEGQDHPSPPTTPAPGPAAPSASSTANAAADQFVGVSDVAPADKAKPTLASKLMKAASRSSVAVAKKDDDAEELAFSVVGSFTSTAEALRVKRSIFHRLVVDSVASLHPPVSDHVIVCSSLRSFKGFLPHLRALHMRASALQKQVVILTQDADSPEVYEMLIEATRASGVAIVVGTPSNPADLVRAGISQASSLLLMADRDGFAEIDGEVLDVGVVFNYLVLEQVLSSVPTQPNFSLVVELLSMDNLEVLNSKRIDMISEMHESSVAREASLSQTTPVSVEPGVDAKPDAPAAAAGSGPAASARGVLTAKRVAMLLNDGHIAPIASAVRSGHDSEAAWSSLADEDERLLAERRRPHVVDASVVENKIFSLPVYNAGYAFPIDSLPTILVANYFDRNVSKFANELLMPDPGGGGARLILEPVPRRFHARTYGELVNEMLTLYDAVVLGLFRSRLAAGSPLPYVLTAPPARCPLFSTDEEEDCMYVLAHQPLFVGANARAPRELAGMEAMYASVRHIDPDQLREPDAAAAGSKRPLVSQISTRKLQAAPEMTATVAAAAATVSELTEGTHLAAPASPASSVFVLPSLGSPAASPAAPATAAGGSRDGLEADEMQLPGVADVHSPTLARRQSAGVTGLANLQSATFAAVLENRRNSVDRRQSANLGTSQRRASLFGTAPSAPSAPPP
jgi:hypothetical protein